MDHGQQPVKTLTEVTLLYKDITKDGNKYKNSKQLAVAQLDQGPEGPGPGKRRDGPGKTYFDKRTCIAKRRYFTDFILITFYLVNYYY